MDCQRAVDDQGFGEGPLVEHSAEKLPRTSPQASRRSARLQLAFVRTLSRRTMKLLPACSSPVMAINAGGRRWQTRKVEKTSPLPSWALVSSRRK